MADAPPRARRRWPLALMLIGVALFAAAIVVARRPAVIDAAAADALAKAAAVRFTAARGEPVAHYGRAVRVAWPDGWEFIWRYRPCPDATALRIFVPLSGRWLRLTQNPDCAAGFGGVLVRA